MGIRVTAKAMILHQGKVLLNRCSDVRNGDYYTLPGGGQNQYETLHDALVRECLEETGYTVRPIRYAALCEEIFDDPFLRAQHPDYAHRMYHIFLCGLDAAARLVPTEQDSMQQGCDWVPVDKLDGLVIKPQAISGKLTHMIQGTSPLFLGSAHIACNHG